MPARNAVITVLIETLWNVKALAPVFFRIHGVVLIETLWNVKSNKKSPHICKCKGINRNIVECKGRICHGNSSPGWVLIETLWNVKRYEFNFFLFFHVVLIETLWNVKSSFLRRASWTAPVLIETLWNVKAIFVMRFCFLHFVLIETLWNVKNNEFDEEYFEFGY